MEPGAHLGAWSQPEPLASAYLLAPSGAVLHNSAYKGIVELSLHFNIFIACLIHAQSGMLREGPSPPKTRTEKRKDQTHATCLPPSNALLALSRNTVPSKGSNNSVRVRPNMAYFS